MRFLRVIAFVSRSLIITEHHAGDFKRINFIILKWTIADKVKLKYITVETKIQFRMKLNTRTYTPDYFYPPWWDHLS